MRHVGVLRQLIDGDNRPSGDVYFVQSLDRLVDGAHAHPRLHDGVNRIAVLHAIDQLDQGPFNREFRVLHHATEPCPLVVVGRAEQNPAI